MGARRRRSTECGSGGDERWSFDVRALALLPALLLTLSACDGGRKAEGMAEIGAGEPAAQGMPVGADDDAAGVATRDEATGAEAGDPMDAAGSSEAGGENDAAGGSETSGQNIAAGAPDADSKLPRLTQLTEAGCCTQPWWSADGKRLHYIDRPDPAGPVGIWSVDVDAAPTAPELLTETIGYYSEDMAYRVDLDGDSTTLVRTADDTRWPLPAGGRPVSISPDGQRVLWQVSPQNVDFERRTTEVWVAALDGSDARQVGSLPRGSVSGWIDDGRVLARGRDSLQAEEDLLWVMDLADGSLRELVRAERLRGELVSPDGRWVAYYVAQIKDPDQTGVWLVPTAGGAPRRLDKALFGAYRWRDAGRLLVVPQADAAESQRIVEVEAESLRARDLTDPSTLRFKIANGDWTISPDASRLAFVESRDKAIWLLELP